MIEYRQYSLLTPHILSRASKNINNNYSLNFNDYWGLSFIVLFWFFSKWDFTDGDLSRWDWLEVSHRPCLISSSSQTASSASHTEAAREAAEGGGGEPPHAASWHSGGWWENVHLAEIIKHERCNYINLHIATNRGNANVLIESPLQFAHNEPQL